MSSTKKQNTKLMAAIAIIFTILIALGFVALLMISAENSPSNGQQHAQINNQSIVQGSASKHLSV